MSPLSGEPSRFLFKTSQKIQTMFISQMLSSQMS
jgi:hypothetical protein